MKRDVLLLLALIAAVVAESATSAREFQDREDAEDSRDVVKETPDEATLYSQVVVSGLGSSSSEDDADPRVTGQDHEFTKDFYTRRLLGLNKRAVSDERTEPKETHGSLEVLVRRIPLLTVEVVEETFDVLDQSFSSPRKEKEIEGATVSSNFQEHTTTASMTVDNDSKSNVSAEEPLITESHEDIDYDHFPKSSSSQTRRRQRFVDPLNAGLGDLYDLEYIGTYDQEVYGVPLVKREIQSPTTEDSARTRETSRVLRQKRQLIASPDFLPDLDDLPDFKRGERGAPQDDTDGATTTVLPETYDTVPLDEADKPNEEAATLPPKVIPSDSSSSSVVSSFTEATVTVNLQAPSAPATSSGSSTSTLAGHTSGKPHSSDSSSSSSSSSSSDSSSSSSSSESREGHSRARRSPQQGQFDGFLLGDFYGHRNGRSVADESWSGEVSSSEEAKTMQPHYSRGVRETTIDEAILGELAIRRFRRALTTASPIEPESTSAVVDAPITYVILPNGTQVNSSSLPNSVANSSSPVKIVHLYTVHTAPSSEPDTTEEVSTTPAEEPDSSATITETSASFPPNPTSTDPQGASIFAKGHLVIEEPPAQMFNSGFSHLPAAPEYVAYPQQVMNPESEAMKWPTADQEYVMSSQEGGANPLPYRNWRPDIVEKTIQVNPDGTFIYSFEISDGTRVAQAGMLRDISALQYQQQHDRQQQEPQQSPSLFETQPQEPQRANTVFGGYSYTAPDGTLVNLRYIADENGFRPLSEPVAYTSWAGDQFDL